MGEDLLARVLEIRERKEAAQAAYEESRRLERPLAALESEKTASGTAATDGRRSRRPAQRRPRAARGANREAILAVVRDRPGTTASEIADATGITRSTVAPCAVAAGRQRRG